MEEFKNAFSIKVPGRKKNTDPFLQQKTERFLNARCFLVSRVARVSRDATKQDV